MTGEALIAVAFAYVLGGLPSSYWMVRWRQGSDVRLVGSGNPGATNVLRVAGVSAAVPVLVVDVGKGVLAIVAARWLGLGETQLGAVGAAAVVGHIFPVWLRFKGGKGVATAGGVFVALAPIAFGVAALAFLVVVVATRIVSLASLAAAVALPIVLWRLGAADPALIAWSVLIAGIVAARHHENIGRLRRGTEPRLALGVREDG